MLADIVSFVESVGNYIKVSLMNLAIANHKELNQIAAGNSLCDAAFQGDLPALKKILQRRDIDQTKLPLTSAWSEKSALNYAISGGQDNVVSFLFTLDIVRQNIASFRNGALQTAAMKDKLESTKRILAFPEVITELGKDPTQGREILVHAARSSLAMLETLLKVPEIEKSIDKSTLGNLITQSARFGKRESLARVLALPGAKEQAADSNNAAFIMAAEEGNEETVDELLKIEAVRNNAAADDNRALKQAVWFGRRSVVERLLRIGEVAALASCRSNQPLALAVTTPVSDIEIVNMLLAVPCVMENITVRENSILKMARVHHNVLAENRLLEIDTVRDYESKKEEGASIPEAEQNYVSASSSASKTCP